METSQKKQKIFYIIIVAAFLFIPFFGFMGILYNDGDLTKYFDMRSNFNDSDLSKITSLEYLPNRSTIYILPIVSVVLFAISIAVLFSLLFIKKSEMENNWRKYNSRVFFSICLVVVALIISAALLGYSEYEFSWFNEWVNSIVGDKNDASSIKENIMYTLNNLSTGGPLSDQLKVQLEDYLFEIVQIDSVDFGSTYNWIGINFVWLVVSLQILLLISSILRIAFNIIFNVNNSFEQKYEELLIQKETFNGMVILRFFKRWFVPNEKNISIGITFTTIIVFLPQIIYIIILESNTTQEHQFINYSYIYPFLFHNRYIFNGLTDLQIKNYYLEFENVNGSLLVVTKIPLFSIFIVFAFVLAFIYVYIKKHEISQKSFFIFFGIFLIVQIIALGMMMNSQIKVMQAVDYWNNSADASYIIKDIFNKDNINLWLKSNELISLMILSLSFLITFSIIQLSQIIKLKRKALETVN